MRNGRYCSERRDSSFGLAKTDCLKCGYFNTAAVILRYVTVSKLSRESVVLAKAGLT